MAQDSFLGGDVEERFESGEDCDRESESEADSTTEIDRVSWSFNM